MPYHARGVVRTSFASFRRTQLATRRADWICEDRSSPSLLQHYGGQRPVLPFVEDSSEEAATPGQSISHHLRPCVSLKRFAAANQKRFWGTLPAIHPRESPGSASSAVMLGKAYRTSRASASTVRESRLCRKNNPARSCEQTVNEWNFLWKAMEKLEETLLRLLSMDTFLSQLFPNS